MISKFVAVVAVAIFLQVLSANASFYGHSCHQPCAPACHTPCTPINVPVPVPCSIPIGKVYSCKSYNLKPTLVGPVSPPCEGYHHQHHHAHGPHHFNKLFPLLSQFSGLSHAGFSHSGLSHSCHPSPPCPCGY